MTELKADHDIMEIGRAAFLHECGSALIKKYAHLKDELFTEAGFKNYAEDLLERMTNPYLADTVSRAGRDVVRKLGINDRIFGTMSLAIEYGIEPNNMALGAMAGIALLLAKAKENNLPGDLRPCLRRGKLVPAKAGSDWRTLDDLQIEKILNWLWTGQKTKYAQHLTEYVRNAKQQLVTLINK